MTADLRWYVSADRDDGAIYAQRGATPSPEDECVGLMGSRDLAVKAVDGHNERLAATSPMNPMGQDIRYR